MTASILVAAAAAWSPPAQMAVPTTHAFSRGSARLTPSITMEEKLGPNRWEGDDLRRPLGQMERLLNARRSWSGAMTTAHVSAAVIDGPPPSEEEMLAGLTWALQRHPMLAACVRGKSKYHVPNAEPYPMHSDYLGRAVAYTKELLRTYPDDDIQRFEPSPLQAEELARRAFKLVGVPDGEEALEAAWRGGFDEVMDGLVLDEDGDGPLWQVTLYRGAEASALVYAANHAVSDQRSFNMVLSEVLAAIARARAGEGVGEPTPLPLPPSVEGALLGKEQRQAEEIKERMELLIGAFGEPWGPEVGGRKWLPR